MDVKKRRDWPDPLRAVLMAQPGGACLHALWAGLCALLFAAVLWCYAGTQGDFAIALTSALCLLILLWGVRPALCGKASAAVWLCVALAGVLAIAGHLSLLTVRPGRYSNVIAPMLDEMWYYDLMTASAWEQSNWSGVYLFVCALVSRLDFLPQMTALKLFDMVCQFLCGAAAARLALACGADRSETVTAALATEDTAQIAVQTPASASLSPDAKQARALFAALACVLAPTMLMNAGVWLHCDATFAMLTLWGLLLLVKDRPLAGCLLWGLALGTKLQSTFLFPLLIPMFMRGKVSLRHLLVLAAAFFASQLAFLLDHQGIASVFARYAQQIDEVKWTGAGLGDNAPGVFGLMRVASVREFSGMGLYLGIASALLVAFALIRARGSLSSEVWLLGALLLAAGLPLILPQMNARCLYLACMLSFALAGNARRLIACALLEFVSFCGYIASIFGAQMLPLTVLSLLAIAAAVLVLLELAQSLAANRTNSPDKEEAHA